MTPSRNTTRPHASARHAIEQLSDLVASGEFSAFLEVDKKNGEPLSSEARQLFASLPAITPATSADEILEFGLWTRLPQNLNQALERPRYRVGRELFVRTHVSYHSSERFRPVGGYDETAPLSFTHRAELRGRCGETFVVAVDRAPALLQFSRNDIFSWNEPTPISLVGSMSGVQYDYNDPLMKANVCAAFLDVSSKVSRLDFSEDSERVLALQAELIHRISSRVRMTYIGRGEGYSGNHVGALINGGQGVCFVQRAVAVALLAPFARFLGFDIQAAWGRTLRLNATHGFAIVTLRPSLKRYVVDPAWKEPLTNLRVAFFGQSYGHDRRLEGIEGSPDVRVPLEAIDLPEVVLS